MIRLCPPPSLLSKTPVSYAPTRRVLQGRRSEVRALLLQGGGDRGLSGVTARYDSRDTERQKKLLHDTCSREQARAAPAPWFGGWLVRYKEHYTHENTSGRRATAAHCVARLSQVQIPVLVLGRDLWGSVTMRFTVVHARTCLATMRRNILLLAARLLPLICAALHISGIVQCHDTQ
jgi:hypothetical protein